MTTLAPQEQLNQDAIALNEQSLDALHYREMLFLGVDFAEAPELPDAKDLTPEKLKQVQTAMVRFILQDGDRGYKGRIDEIQFEKGNPFKGVFSDGRTKPAKVLRYEITSDSKSFSPVSGFDLSESEEPVDFAGSKAFKKQPVCSKGWGPCGYACLPHTKKNCKSGLDGQAKTYADWLKTSGDKNASKAIAASVSSGSGDDGENIDPQGIPKKVTSVAGLEPYVRAWQKDRGYNKEPVDVFFDIHDIDHALTYAATNRTPESIHKDYATPGTKYNGTPSLGEEAFITLAEAAFLKGATKEAAIDHAYYSNYQNVVIGSSSEFLQNLTPEDKEFYSSDDRWNDLDRMYDELMAAPPNIKDLLSKNSARFSRVRDNGLGEKFVELLADSTVKKKNKKGTFAVDFVQSKLTDAEIENHKRLKEMGASLEGIAAALARSQHSINNVMGDRTQSSEEIFNEKLALVKQLGNAEFVQPFVSHGSVNFSAEPEYEITIFRSGKHTDSRGVAREFSDRDLQQVVETYNPHHFKAPLIVSHNTGEYSDRDLIESELAFGFPEKIKKVGSTLKAVFKKISPQFVEWLKSGRILDLSPSFYLPEHPGNPYPGKFSLRHIAGLGKSPPAVKGMNPYATLSLSEVEESRANLENSWAIDLSEFGLDDEDEAVSFSQPVETSDFCGMGYAGMAIADLWQNLRDHLIDQESLEVAERVVPTDILRMLRSDAGMDSKPDWMGAYQDLQGQIDSLRSQINSNDNYATGYSEGGTADFMNTGGLKKALASADMGAIAKATKMSIADLAAIQKGDLEPDEEQAAALMKALGMSDKKEKTTSMSEEWDIEKERAAIAAERQALALARRAIEEEKETAFAESLKGVKPAERADVVKALMTIPNSEEVEFSEESGGKRSPRDFVKSLLQRLDPLVSFGEFAPETPQRDRTLSFSAPDGFSVDTSGDKQYLQVLAFCESKGLDPTNPDNVAQAMRSLEAR